MQAQDFQPTAIANRDITGIDAWDTCDNRHSTIACPTSEVLDLIAHKWTVQIIYYLHQQRVLRFRQLHRLVAPITQKELTKRLRKLESVGLINRTAYAEVPPRVEYQLTELGLTLVQPLAVLAQWAEDNLDTIKAHQSQNQNID
ncbi:helix-turn-helix domain-containing protein [Leptolyngbya sp. FACHB-261]|uniref:winged helix-turn-helix transcriptional regulator n=1 Tax=Leptolyngbya sp. FACHB-261 TaxID=2692806 RepID=UPI0016869308|nr:helix-turn-helix domain-containing protein [Leptolyngbya sp. FACHB-261]MBD2104105.1 helix-turn-helix transcriptional regulator [Leptolyngbya sp. FACHB-261]